MSYRAMGPGWDTDSTWCLADVARHGETVMALGRLVDSQKTPDGRALTLLRLADILIWTP